MSNTYKDNLKKVRKNGRQHYDRTKGEARGFSLDSVKDLAWSGARFPTK